VFRRKSSDTEVPAPATETSSAVQGKGAPTPTRKEAEAARKARLGGTTGDPKADKKAAREADRKARYEARLALQAGDERRLPARDAGPVKAYVRDFVDGRISAGELFIPVALVVLVAGFIRIQWVQVILLWAWSAMLLGVILEGRGNLGQVRRLRGRRDRLDLTRAHVEKRRLGRFRANVLL